MPFKEDIYFDYENVPVTLVATRKIPRIETPGISIDETEANRTVNVNLWVAWELVKAGFARFTNDSLNDEEWTQIHYRERLQPIGKLTTIPDKFYYRAYLTFLKNKEAETEDGQSERLNRLKAMFRDILESRIGKIVRLAASEAAVKPRALQPEEVALYDELQIFISSWRKEMKMLGAG